MNKIALVINSKEAKVEWLKQALNTAQGFDEKIVYLDGVKIPHDFGIPDPNGYYGEPCKVVGDGEYRDIRHGYNLAASEVSEGTDWICIFCDDDYFLTDNLLDLISRVKAGEFDNADIIHFKVEVDSGTWGAEVVGPGSFEGGNVIPAGSFIRKSVWDALGGHKINCYADWNLWRRAVAKGFRFQYYNRPVYFFRMGHDCATKRMLAIAGGEERAKLAVMETA